MSSSYEYQIAKLKQKRAELLVQEHKLKKQRLDLMRWRRNPDMWLEERFGEDAKAIFWDRFGGYEEHEWDGTENPLYVMWKAICEGNWVGAKSGTGTGKTYILARIVFWFLDVYPSLGLVVTAAPKEKQLKELLWKEIQQAFEQFKRIRPFAEMTNLRLICDSRSDRSSVATGLVASVSAGEESATKAQGLHARDMLIITEETPGINPAIMKAFVGTANGENNMILAVGNPDSNHDGLSYFIENNNRVKEVRISGYDHPNVVNDKEIIGGAVTRLSIEQKLYSEGGNHDGFLVKSRVRGLVPDQTEDSLIRLSWIKEAVIDTNTVEFDQVERDWSGNAIGVDVSNSKDGDMAAIARGESNILVELKEFQCPDASHIAYNLLKPDSDLLQGKLFKGQEQAHTPINIYHLPKIYHYDIYAENIGVDAVGVGVSTISAFDLMGYTVTALQGGADKEAIVQDSNKQPMYNFDSLRAQMYWQLREDLQRGIVKIYIADPSLLQRLFKELTAIRYSISNKAISIEKKEAIKKRLGKSPNLADAVVYWNWVRTNRKRNSTANVSEPIPFI